MGLLANMKQAAESVGINAFITNSDEKIDTQLNRLTREESLPIMLVSWDLEKGLNFTEHGWLASSGVKVVSLLVTKPEDLTKDNAEESAEEMGLLFEQFLMKLYGIQSPLVVPPVEPVSDASYKLVPWQGISKHSGVLGRFTVGSPVQVPCD